MPESYFLVPGRREGCSSGDSSLLPRFRRELSGLLVKQSRKIKFAERKFALASPQAHSPRSVGRKLVPVSPRPHFCLSASVSEVSPSFSPRARTSGIVERAPLAVYRLLESGWLGGAAERLETFGRGRRPFTPLARERSCTCRRFAHPRNQRRCLLAACASFSNRGGQARSPREPGSRTKGISEG